MRIAFKEDTYKCRECGATFQNRFFCTACGSDDIGLTETVNEEIYEELNPDGDWDWDDCDFDNRVDYQKDGDHGVIIPLGKRWKFEDMLIHGATVLEALDAVYGVKKGVAV